MRREGVRRRGSDSFRIQAKMAVLPYNHMSNQFNSIAIRSKPTRVCPVVTARMVVIQPGRVGRKALTGCTLFRVNMRLVRHTSQKPEADLTVRKILSAVCGVRQGVVGHFPVGHGAPHSSSASWLIRYKR